jgi:hypothetical protein
MGAVVKLLERLGFVRLRDFGLIISPERRLLTTRSAVLDDGFGGIVVGWSDSDLATTELTRWGTTSAVSAKPVSPPQPMIAPVLAPQPTKLAPVPPREPMKLAPVPPPQPIKLAPARPLSVELAAGAAEQVAPQPCEDSPDEWEWEIAMARARAASEDAAPSSPNPAPRPITPRAKRPADDDAPTQVVVANRVPVAQSEPKRSWGDSPRTIIPVPTLPTSTDRRLVRGFGELTGKAPPLRRFPSATTPGVRTTRRTG